MGKKNYYAVRKGRRQGLFSTWAQCEAAVKGFPGAEFQGFAGEAEARAYLEAGDVILPDAVLVDSDGESEDVPTAESAKRTEETVEDGKKDAAWDQARKGLPADCLVAYVDGSYHEGLGRYSFGCVLLTPEGDVFQEMGNGENPESLAIRNVAGEMLGAMYAVRWAMVNGYGHVLIRYDYQGIEKWATGGWKANHPLTKKYADYMGRQRCRIRVEFEKVKAHAGDYYNEEADRLAKEALTEADGVPEVRDVRKNR